MPRYGYARVSTSSQDLAIQIAKLEEAQCRVVRSETASGATREQRTELKKLLDFVGEGDELVVHRLGSGPIKRIHIPFALCFNPSAKRRMV